MLCSFIILILAGCPATDEDRIVDHIPSDTDQDVVADAGPDREVEVGTPITLEAGESGGGPDAGATFLWDFGDGLTSEGYQVTHTWNAPGNLAVVLQVTDDGGGTRSDSARLTAYLPAASTKPAFSGPMVLEDGWLWAAVPEADHVIAVHQDGDDAVEIEVCGGPRTLFADGGVIAVACEDAGEVSFIDVSTKQVTETVRLAKGSRPYGIIGRDGEWMVGQQGTGTIATVSDGDVTLERNIGADPRALGWTPGGTLLATRFRSTDQRGLVWLLGDDPIELALDPGPDSDTTNRGTPNLLHAAVISPDGDTLYVGGLQANVSRGAFRDGQALTHETTLRATVRVIDLDLRTDRFEDRKLFDEQGVVGALTLSPRGTWLYAAHTGTGTIHVLDAFTMDLSGSILDAGQGINALAVSDDGDTLYVHAWLDRQLHAYDLTLPSAPALLWSADTVSEEPLSAEVLLGKRIFYNSADTRMTASGYLTCAHCHPDGRDDGITWDFTDRGEGLRNTTSLEGRAGTSMGPLHWTANFDEIQDFEHDIRNAFGGSGFLDDADWAATNDTLGASKAGLNADLDALAAYVASLDTTPTNPTPADQVGLALFESSGCADCHMAPLYTDSSLTNPVRHDVGTIRGASGLRLGDKLEDLDTPTLLGTFATGPWLHDGTAETLEEAIAAHNTHDLAGDELAAVARFVGSL